MWDKFQLSVSDREIYGNSEDAQMIVKSVLKSMATATFEVLCDQIDTFLKKFEGFLLTCHIIPKNIPISTF